jgi:hypothetical protein
MQLVASNLTTGLFLLGMMLIILTVLRGTKKNLKSSSARRQQFDSDCAHDTLELRPYTDKPAQLLRWEVEMHDLARDLMSKLDTKIAMLQRLLIAAEVRERGLASALPSCQTPAVTRDQQQPQVTKRDRLSEIYRLADEGFPSQEIASKLHSALGDVELILSLPRQSARQLS